MKTSATFLLLACCSFLLSPASSPAQVLASDNLAGYTVDAPPAGARHGTGWANQPWSFHKNARVTVREDESGRYFEIAGDNTSRALVRRLATPAGADGKPVYFRSQFSVQTPGEKLSAKIFGGWYFVDAKGYSTTLSTAVIGGPGHTATARIGEQSEVLRGAGATTNPGQKRTLVAKLDGWDAEKSVFTRMTVWLDPDPALGEQEQTLSATTTVPEGGSGPVTLLQFRIHNLEDTAFRIYNVRLASAWQDVIKD